MRDLPDLRAVFPGTSRSLRPSTEVPGFLSWGCPKIAPPSTSAKESTPGRLRVLRGGLPHPPAFRPRGFTPPRRFAPLSLCRLVSSRCRSWGSSRFHRSRNQFPRGAIPPFEAFPPPTARPMSPSRLPSRPFLSAFAEPGPQGFAPSSGPLPSPLFPAGRPGAPMGLAGPAPALPPPLSPGLRRTRTARWRSSETSSCTSKIRRPLGRTPGAPTLETSHMYSSLSFVLCLSAMPLTHP